MTNAKHLAVAFLLGVVISVCVIYFWTNADKKIKAAVERRDVIAQKASNVKKETESILARQQKENTEIVKKQNEKRKQIEKVKKEIAQVDVKDLQGLLKKKDDQIKLQNDLIFDLEFQVDVLKRQNNELQDQLQQSYSVSDDAVQALNMNLLDLRALSAKDKAMKIGLGVGLPLAIVGGFVGGWYISGAIKR